MMNRQRTYKIGLLRVIAILITFHLSPLTSSAQDDDKTIMFNRSVSVVRVSP